MISKDLIFEYDNIDIWQLYNKTVENNNEMIKIIPEIVEYKQGTWKNEKRKDKLICKLLNIPENLRTIIRQIFLNKNDEIGCKLKIEKKVSADKTIIRLKIKMKLKNMLSNLILKIFKFRVYIDIKREELKTIANVRYEINSLLINEINEYIENKLNNYFISKIDNFVKKINL